MIFEKLERVDMEDKGIEFFNEVIIMLIYFNFD